MILLLLACAGEALKDDTGDTTTPSLDTSGELEVEALEGLCETSDTPLTGDTVTVTFQKPEDSFDYTQDNLRFARWQKVYACYNGIITGQGYTLEDGTLYNGEEVLQDGTQGLQVTLPANTIFDSSNFQLYYVPMLIGSTFVSSPLDLVFSSGEENSSVEVSHTEALLTGEEAYPLTRIWSHPFAWLTHDTEGNLTGEYDYDFEEGSVVHDNAATINPNGGMHAGESDYDYYDKVMGTVTGTDFSEPDFENSGKVLVVSAVYVSYGWEAWNPLLPESPDALFTGAEEIGIDDAESLYIAGSSYQGVVVDRLSGNDNYSADSSVLLSSILNAFYSAIGANHGEANGGFLGFFPGTTVTAAEPERPEWVNPSYTEDANLSGEPDADETFFPNANIIGRIPQINFGLIDCEVYNGDLSLLVFGSDLLVTNDVSASWGSVAERAGLSTGDNICDLEVGTVIQLENSGLLERDIGGISLSELTNRDVPWTLRLELTMVDGINLFTSG